jgi:hypothetical protein
MQHVPTDSEIQPFISSIDKNGDNMIELNELLEYQESSTGIEKVFS